MYTIGEKITNLSKEKKMIQKYLSDLLKVSRQTVSKWEIGKVCSDINNLLSIKQVDVIKKNNMKKLDLNLK